MCKCWANQVSFYQSHTVFAVDLLVTWLDMDWLWWRMYVYSLLFSVCIVELSVDCWVLVYALNTWTCYDLSFTQSPCGGASVCDMNNNSLFVIFHLLAFNCEHDAVLIGPYCRKLIVLHQVELHSDCLGRPIVSLDFPLWLWLVQTLIVLDCLVYCHSINQ